MDKLEQIHNDALVKAIAAMTENRTKETQDTVTRQMIRASFLMPVTTIKGKSVDLEDLPPRVLQNDKGQKFLPLFTDMAAMRLGMPGLSQAVIIVDISDVFANLKEFKNFEGVILNPFSKPNLMLNRSLTENLARLWSRVRTAELNGEKVEDYSLQPKSVKLMVPKQYPDGVTFSLIGQLKKIPDVTRAFLCAVQVSPEQKQEDCNWMVIIDTETTIKGREETFLAVAKAIAPYLGKHNITFTENNAQFADLTSRATPIYERSEQLTEDDL